MNTQDKKITDERDHKKGISLIKITMKFYLRGVPVIFKVSEFHS